MGNGDRPDDLINDYAAVRISLASPADIRSWSFGEVKKPKTLNHRTYRPEADGLFCERIFGPEKDWECACGKYRGMHLDGKVCERCGVKVTHSRVRRKRMGHIELAAPVVHIWFFKTMPSQLGTLLDMKTGSLANITYFQDYVVIDPGGTPLKERQLLTEAEFNKARESFGNQFEATSGVEAVKRLLQGLNLGDVSRALRQQLREVGTLGNAGERGLCGLVRRLEIVEALRDSGNRPEWMVLECLPVIPPGLRPEAPRNSGRSTGNDLNDLYCRIINRNNRVKKLLALNVPEVIIRNEKRMLQQSVDALFDNNRCKRPVLRSSNRPLESLTDRIKAKQGRFRESQMGKRVDYSARSVIVVGPELRVHQCGLPKKIALELFRPFVLGHLIGHDDPVVRGRARALARLLAPIPPANRVPPAGGGRLLPEQLGEGVWEVLAEVMKGRPVLLSRRPTLQRERLQAFEPVLTEGNAIRLHPLVCAAMGVDFDGDQMAVHLPLSIEAQVEATILMLSTNNLFSPANGQPIISPSQDIVMGCYYLTATRGEMGESGEPGEGKVFSSPAEVFLAYAHQKVGVHARIAVRLPIEKKVFSEIKISKDKTAIGEVPRKPNGLVATTAGRVVFNDILNPKMPFYDVVLSSKQLSRIITDCYQLLGRRETIDLLDRMKDLGFGESTRSGLSLATDDLRTPVTKEKVLAETEKQVDYYSKQYDRGNVCEAERYNKVIDLWTHARDVITTQMMDDLRNDKRLEEDGIERPYLNPIFLMANSGARGGTEQIRQLAGMRGLMARPNGTIIEMPIKANFREGLSVLEYFSSANDARTALRDKAQQPADPAYLTRKLIDTAGNVIVTMHDCGTKLGVTKAPIWKGDSLERPLSESIRGRIACRTLIDRRDGSVIVAEKEMITPDKARLIEGMGIDKIRVRSPMTCQAPWGICRLCYGMDLSTGNIVEEGTAVGIVAAHSISEPSTQLTMRTFFIGSWNWRAVEESEHRAGRAGTVKFERIAAVVNDKNERVALTRNGEIAIRRRNRILESFSIPNGATLLVEEGQEVERGQWLCKWDPHQVPILAEVGGKVRFDEIVEGETLRKERGPDGSERWVILEHTGDLHPQLLIEDDQGQVVASFYLPEKAFLEVCEGQKVSAGTLLAKKPREVAGTVDIAGGLPRVMDLFEARTPRNPAHMAEVAGIVRLGEKKADKRTIYVQPVDDAGRPSGEEKEHRVPAGRHLRVHTGDRIKEGDRLIFGPLVPHEILKILGPEAVQQYLLEEIQSLHRVQRLEIDDKHIEIILAQMLRQVKVETPGDTGLLPGSVIDKLAFRAINDRLKECVKVKDPGDSRFELGKIVGKEAYGEEHTRLEADGKEPPTFTAPTPATCSTLLLGITKAAVQSDSFISAASLRETTKVLTEAALAGKVDPLTGLKENVILGRVIPAGTGFPAYRQAEVQQTTASSPGP
jgi:DNA-directed RNA polymerase subunit beta'